MAGKQVKVKSAREKWQELLEGMGEEAARRFVEQVDVLAREDALEAQLQAKEKELQAQMKAKEEIIRAEVVAMEEALQKRNQELQERMAELTEREQTLAGCAQETAERSTPALEEAQPDLEERKRELELQMAELAKQNQAMEEREQRVGEREKKIEEREAAADQRSVAIDRREQEILERETNAENGFARQSRQVMEALRQRKQAIDAEVQAWEKEQARREKEQEDDLAALYGKRKEALEKELAQFHKQRTQEAEQEASKAREAAGREASQLREAAEKEARKLREAAEKEVSQLREAAEKEVSQLRETAEQEAAKTREAARREAVQLREAAEEMAVSQKSFWEAEKNRIQERSRELEEQQHSQEQKERELKREKWNLQIAQEDIKNDREWMEEQIEERVSRRAGEMQKACQQAKKDAEYYKKCLEASEESLEAYRDQDRESGGLTRQELLEKLAAAEAEMRALKKQRHPDLALHAQYKAKAKDYDDLLRRHEELQDRFSDLELQKSRWMLTVRQHDLAQQRLQAAEVERAALEASILRCQAEVERMTSLYDKAKNTQARKAPIEQPYFTLPERVASGMLTEVEWLDGIFEKCNDSGIRFNKRLLYAFHTALKTSGWSPLTVLAGVSGTGKSLLPLLYSRFGGIYFISMAVQPDWDSPQALFGYFNAIDNKYNPTTLIQSMVQFGTSEEALEKETNLSDYMLIVLLDEMNLAHVELYFSDMLSKLEQRRNSGENVMIDIDLGADAPKYQLELNDNILWVGTMNEDETTKSLSDKVLDRGNLISFPRPRSFVSKSKNVLEKEGPMLPKQIWDGWVGASVIGHPQFQARIEAYRSGLERINEQMGVAGRSLGHRVWQSIENYMGNHPHVIGAVTAEQVDDGICKAAMGEAFEEALAYKVMPKLRGIETEGITRERCIEPIREILFGEDGLAKGLEKDFKNAVENAYETFLWSSAEYLELEE